MEWIEYLKKYVVFFWTDTDYNHQKTKEILDNYYKNKRKNKMDDDEAVGLKDKQDWLYDLYLISKFWNKR